VRGEASCGPRGSDRQSTIPNGTHPRKVRSELAVTTRRRPDPVRPIAQRLRDRPIEPGPRPGPRIREGRHRPRLAGAASRGGEQGRRHAPPTSAATTIIELDVARGHEIARDAGASRPP
jgi:hypothetical protein